MDGQPQIDINQNFKVAENLAPHTNRKYKVALVILSIVTIISLCFGIYGTIQAIQTNQAMHEIEANSDEIYDDEELIDSDEYDDDFGLPTSASSINSVWIDYNDCNDSIYIYDDGTVGFYTIDGNTTSERTISMNVTELIEDAFNDLVPNLNAYDMGDDVSWSVTVYSNEGLSYVGGTDAEPEWLTQFIDEVTDIVQE